MGGRPFLVALGALLIGGLLLVAFRARNGQERYQTAAVDRGDVVDVVGATGALEAVTTVQVGSQVSGTIQSLGADFNQAVKKGQVVARLDPSLFEARVQQARANLASARANVDKARADQEDTRQKLQRAKELSAQDLLPAADLETAQAAHDSAAAQLKAAQAAVSQAAANLNQAEVDLGHTVIRAPIDGVVIARNVDVGQTVAASLQAPTLFVIANDLSRMRVNASVDEADVGRVRAGQDVTFRVDAYPEQTFAGRIEQVRLQPTTTQNVVTYNTIIAVDNASQRLMPGMTATVSIVVRRSEDVLRVPAAALRFRPEGFQARRAASPRPGESGAPSQTAPGQVVPRQAAPGQADAGARAWRRPGMEGATAGGEPRGGPGGEGASALVFVLDDKGRPQPRRIQVGISDGQYVEVRSGLDEDARVITGLESAARGASPRPGASPTNNPFSPQFQRRQR